MSEEELKELANYFGTWIYLADAQLLDGLQAALLKLREHDNG